VPGGEELDVGRPTSQPLEIQKAEKDDDKNQYLRNVSTRLSACVNE